MIFEHEIPNGSKLYFGNSAKVKRSIENIASDILDKNGFEEIITPTLSYWAHQSIDDEKEFVKDLAAEESKEEDGKLEKEDSKEQMKEDDEKEHIQRIE